MNSRPLAFALRGDVFSPQVFRLCFISISNGNFLEKNCFTSATWKCSDSICAAHKFTLTTPLGLNDSVNEYCVAGMIMFDCIYSKANMILHRSRCGSSFAISPQGQHRWDCIQSNMTEPCSDCLALFAVNC